MHLNSQIMEEFGCSNTLPRQIWQYCIQESKKHITWNKYKIVVDPCDKNGIIADIIRDKELINLFNIYSEKYNSNLSVDNKDYTLIITQFSENSWKEDIKRFLKYASTFILIVPETEFNKNSLEEQDLLLLHSENIKNENYDTGLVLNIYEKRNNLIDSLLRKYFGGNR